MSLQPLNLLMQIKTTANHLVNKLVRDYQEDQFDDSTWEIITSLDNLIETFDITTHV